MYLLNYVLFAHIIIFKISLPEEKGGNGPTRNTTKKIKRNTASNNFDVGLLKEISCYEKILYYKWIEEFT